SGPRLGVKSIDAGTIHTCVVTLTVGTETTGTTAYCWGRNNSGQLGDGTLTDRRAPAAIPAIQYSTIATGGAHSCGTDLNSQALCWGQNEKGQLGNGTTIRSLTPALVAKP
ncbi:MAG: RCC1 repeat-containing protein, partial [Gemmatimonadetes bacterium]|nr:RCC1 repeat-containing protein [Gemmatimonadota bacterium]